MFAIDDVELELLLVACRRHTDGLVDGEITVQVCWDADRLDLGRVGITPRPALLCTDSARANLRWADDRAVRGHVPDLVTSVWKL